MFGHNIKTIVRRTWCLKEGAGKAYPEIISVSGQLGPPMLILILTHQKMW